MLEACGRRMLMDPKAIPRFIDAASTSAEKAGVLRRAHCSVALLFGR